MGNRNGATCCIRNKKDTKNLATSDNLSSCSGKFLLKPQTDSCKKETDSISETLNADKNIANEQKDDNDFAREEDEEEDDDDTQSGITDCMHTETNISDAETERTGNECEKNKNRHDVIEKDSKSLRHVIKEQRLDLDKGIFNFRSGLTVIRPPSKLTNETKSFLQNKKVHINTLVEMKDRQQELLTTLENGLSDVKESSLQEMERLGELLEELQSDLNVFNDILGKVYAMIKLQTTDKQNQQVVHMLINTNILAKMDTYLKGHNINSLMDLKVKDNQCMKVWLVIKKFLTITWTICDRNVNFCQYVLETKTFLFLLSELRSLSSVNYEAMDIFLFSIKAVLGVLHNISRHLPNSKWTLRNEGLVTILRTFLPSHIPMIRLKALIILSYILSEAENEIINSDDDNFVFVFQVLSDALKSENHRSKKYGMNASEVLKGINNLAINDENKIRIVRNGALPLYEIILATDGFSDEKKVTIMTLWSLAFHHYNKRKMREMPGIMERLYELRQCDDEEICHAARGTFWELENTSKSVISKTFSSSAEKDPNQPHIMISYQWDSQPIMIKVKDRLRHAGYKVWMDVEHMTGSTLEAMALAVEKAAVVLVCMSQKYKDSPNCRTEAEYVYRLRKDFVPLRLQCEYTPDGWLGILVGTRLYFDMYSEEALDAQLPRLVKELRDRGRISPSTDEVDIGSVLAKRMISREAVPLLHMSESNEVKNWDSQNVLDWLTSLALEEVYECLRDMDGSLLMEMQKIQKTAPEFFYSMLRDELKLTTVTLLKFSKALRCLR